VYGDFSPTLYIELLVFVKPCCYLV
jgi:hypothetical protein